MTGRGSAPAAPFTFAVPSRLAASAPPEARGVPRDGVRLLVAHRGEGTLRHRVFRDLPEVLEPGDLLVVNTSGTLPAALEGVAADGRRVTVHLSTHLDHDRWVVEPRRPIAGGASERWSGEPPPCALALPDGGTLTLLVPYRAPGRLWIAHLELPRPWPSWLGDHGRPIRYRYVERDRPRSDYQCVFATEPGSAEMPSAGRPFTEALVTRLVASGVGIAPLLLHTGVASLEAGEQPYPERAVVPVATAERVEATRAAGRRVIAVGTTVVRALESAVDASGRVRPFDGWTDLVVTPERGVRVVDGLVTGWHEPFASHLLMLAAIAGLEVLRRSYEEALIAGYLWHEFGDSYLILP